MPGGRRIALVSVHTSPLDAPGAGDAGGMNVYVAALARHLALGGADVDVLTRADPGATDVVDVSPVPGGRVRVVPVPVAGPSQVAKDALPAHLPAFAAEVLRLAGEVPPGRPPYDVVHGHYWLSGEVAVTLGAAWHVPVVQTMHTLAAAKEAAGGTPESPARRAGERRVTGAAAALVCSTEDEAAELVDLVGADPGRVHVVPPGVDTDLFSPAGTAVGPAADLDDRDALGVPRDALLVLFVGRVQPHKGPDLLVRAVAAAVANRPDVRRRLLVTVLGGPSGPEGRTVADLEDLARGLGVADLLSWRGPVPRDELARWYRAADVVAVPSRHESFGLVALEAQASGTAVLAARAGGLVTAVDDGVSGVLVDGRDPAEWGRRLLALLDDPLERARLGGGGRRHAERFSWAATAAATAAVYEEVIGENGGEAGGGPRDAAPAARAVRRFLDAAGVDHGPGTRPGEVVATVPGERRRSIVVSFLAGAHSVSASSFVCRRPEDDPSAVHAWLLRRNARLPGIAFAVDAHGDIHLVGRVPSAAVAGPSGQAVLDDLLGAVVRTVEDSFDEILARGFATAIRAEHAWRVSRGLPTDNLAAFARIIDGTAPTVRDDGL